MKQFFTREKANEGITIDLPLPNGEPSGETMHILGTDSDVFRRAENQAIRELTNATAECTGKDGVLDQTAYDTMSDDIKLTLVASLVVSWSFEEECTLENVKNFLYNAPGIFDLVDARANKRANFTKPV